MSYKMSFQGAYVFRDEAARDDAVADLGGTAITEQHVQLVGTTIRIQCNVKAPSTQWEATCATLREISRRSTRGYINAQFDGGTGDASIVRHRYHAGGNIEHMKGPFPADE